MKKAALITGSAKRIGRETAIFLAQKGYDIAIHYNTSKKESVELAQEITKKFKVKCKIFKANLLNQKEAEKLAKSVLKEFSNLSLLINNASIFNKSKFLDFANDELLNNFNIHFFSPLILSKEFAKHINAKQITEAQIINIVDKNIVRFDTSYFYYLLSKKLLAEFTKMLSLELAPTIRVNAVAPGFIINNVHETNPENETKILSAKIPLKNKGDIKNILQSIDFLLLNKFITGQIIFVDGGASLNHAG